MPAETIDQRRPLFISALVAVNRARPAAAWPQSVTIGHWSASKSTGRPDWRPYANKLHLTNCWRCCPSQSLQEMSHPLHEFEEMVYTVDGSYVNPHRNRLPSQPWFVSLPPQNFAIWPIQPYCLVSKVAQNTRNLPTGVTAYSTVIQFTYVLLNLAALSLLSTAVVRIRKKTSAQVLEFL